MTPSELENWRATRNQGRSRFLRKIIWERCLWFSIPLIITLVVTGFGGTPAGGFWAEYNYLIWTFAVVTLLIGLGDAVFIWKARERDFQRKTRLVKPGQDSA